MRGLLCAYRNPRDNFGVSWKASNYSLPNNQFNPAAFSEPAGNYGTCPRNYGRGPGFIQPDLGILKTTKLFGHVDWEFRGELFNFVNHPNFAGPGTTTNGLTLVSALRRSVTSWALGPHGRFNSRRRSSSEGETLRGQMF